MAAGENSGVLCSRSSTVSSWQTCAMGDVSSFTQQMGCHRLWTFGTRPHCHTHVCIQGPASRTVEPTSCSAAGSSSSEPQCASTMPMSCNATSIKLGFSRVWQGAMDL